MSLNKTKDELLAELDVAKAGYDSAEVGRLEEEIKKLNEITAEHTEEMKEKTEEVNKEQTMKKDELMNMLQDKPENADENADEIIKQAKARISQTISRYTDKIKEMKTANETDKEKLSKELADIKAELKKEKDNYQKTKEDFFAKSEYEIKKFSKEDLGKASTKRYRFKVREGKLLNSPKLTKMKTIRRNMTIKKLIKKFNKIGNNEKNGVRFVMWFEKARFLRYTGVKINTAMDKAWSGMGMQMNPQQFHTAFNAGRKNIFAILNADTGDTLETGEKEIITALKKRINYYGYAYARERANARVNPFVEAEKTASEDEKILTPQKNTEEKTAKKIQMTPPQKEENLDLAA